MGHSQKNCGTGNKYTSFFTGNGILKFNFEEHGPVNIVTHQHDLKDLFLDVDVDALQVNFRIALCSVTSLYLLIHAM